MSILPEERTQPPVRICLEPGCGAEALTHPDKPPRCWRHVSRAWQSNTRHPLPDPEQLRQAWLEIWAVPAQDQDNRRQIA